jgi:hypothetical protein
MALRILGHDGERSWSNAPEPGSGLRKATGSRAAHDAAGIGLP